MDDLDPVHGASPVGTAEDDQHLLADEGHRMSAPRGFEVEFLGQVQEGLLPVLGVGVVDVDGVRGRRVIGGRVAPGEVDIALCVDVGPVEVRPGARGERGDAW